MSTIMLLEPKKLDTVPTTTLNVSTQSLFHEQP